MFGPPRIVCKRMRQPVKIANVWRDVLNDFGPSCECCLPEYADAAS